MLRRKENKALQLDNNELMKIKSYNYDKNNKLVFQDSNIIKLSAKESSCLFYLIKNRNTYVSHESLIAHIWYYQKENASNSLRELVYRLRKKLPSLEIDTCPNIGYILKT